MIDDHATEETSGIEEFIFLNIPWEINSAVLGITPVSVKSLIIPKGTPSRPIITVFAFFVTISAYSSNYSAGTYVFILDKDKTPQFLDIIEVLDGHRFFGFDDDFGNLKILDHVSIFSDNFER